jgi:hypothetical protein
MRTATPNLLILTVQSGTDIITGTAIDADILVNFAVANTEVNQRLFVPSAQLVVTGKFRLGKEIATIGIWISSVTAIISIPAPASVEIAATAPIATAESSASVEVLVEPETTAIEVEDSVLKKQNQPAIAQTRAQKAASTRAAKKSQASTAAVAS